MTQAIARPPQKSQVAIVKEQVVDQVAKKVQGFLQSGQLHLPPGYSPVNAMHAAWLKLQEVKDTKGRLALETCSKASIANALFKMVVQALDPAKEQCYFIAYGEHLTCQLSYFGAIAMARRMSGVEDVLPMVRYEGEEFELAIERGRYVVERHKPDINRKPGTPITHAYVVIEYADGRPPKTEVMTWDQIQTSWKKSRGNPQRDGSPHREQPDQMSMRTVIMRGLKRDLKSSSDHHLGELLAEIERVDTIAAAETELYDAAAEHANRELLTLDNEPPTIDLESSAGLTPEEMAEAEARDLADAQADLDARRQQGQPAEPGF